MKTKEVFLKFKKNHPALTAADILLIMGFTQKYGASLVQDMENLLTPEQSPKKYKRNRETLAAQQEVVDL